VSAPPYFAKRGDVVSLAGYAGHKVGVVLGTVPSSGRVRVAVLRAVSKRWALPQSFDPGALTPAPKDWRATRLARKLLAEGGMP
jgi:hypothetical protein